MLILVAVTVNVAVNSGLFGNAQSATRGYSEKQAEEQAIGDGTFNIVVNGEEYGSMDEYLAAQIPPELDRSNIQVGDYIAYTPDTASAYSLTNAVSGYGSADSPQNIAQETLQWRVMNINADGSVDLISALPISTNVYFSGALGYNNGVLVLNDICKKHYSNASLGAIGRSLDLFDIESNMNDTGIAARNACEYDNIKYGQTKIYESDSIYIPDIFGKTGVDAEGESEDYYTSTTTATAVLQSSVEVTQTIYSFSSTSSTYFDNQTFYEMVFGTETSYWLASRFCYCYSPNAVFGLRRVASSAFFGGALFDSSNNASPLNYRVRPVVTLGSNIKISTEGGTADAPRTISL